MIELRPVTSDDAAFLERVYASTREEELARVPWSDEEKRAFLSMQFRAQRDHYEAHFPAARFDVVIVDGAPAGRLYVDPRVDELRIVDIALLPELRGRGVGSSLLGDVLREAESSGRAVRIHVERENPAMRLYVRLGFRKIGDAGVYWLMERAAARRDDSGEVRDAR